MSSAFSQTFPPKPEFSVDTDIPDLTGKVIIVTGANTGIGKETARVLLNHNAKVYIAARSSVKAEAAIQELKNSTGNEALYLSLDLSSLKSIKASVEEFKSKEKEVHVLFNNAGVMNSPVEQVTADGYDLQFGTNVLGHFYFTKLLLPLLLNGAKSSPDGKARVVTTSSFGHTRGALDFATFKDGVKRRQQDTLKLYSQSKFGNIVFANELARRYGAEGIVSTSVHPGIIKSDLLRTTKQNLMWKIISFMAHPVELGALSQLRAGVSPEGAEWNGQYLIPWARLGKPLPATADPETGSKLWTWLEEQVQDI